MYNNNIIDLCENYEINKNKNITVKLIEKNEIIDMKYMFYECKSLLSIVKFSKWKSKNVN